MLVKYRVKDAILVNIKAIKSFTKDFIVIYARWLIGAVLNKLGR
jgi:hypothetical protein